MSGTLILSFITIVGVIALIVYTDRRNKKANNQLSSFAKEHGWKTNTKSPIAPALLKQGYTSGPSIFEGSLGNKQFWLYECNPPVYQTGKQRGSTSVVLLTIPFSAEFPSLLLVPGAANLANAFDEVAAGFGLQRLTLEGDFSQNVLTFTETGKEVSTLEYLTPDVMAKVMNNITSVILFSGNYISISRMQLEGIQTAELMIKEAEQVIDILKRKLS